jgi:hypothetical protein
VKRGEGGQLDSTGKRGSARSGGKNCWELRTGEGWAGRLFDARMPWPVQDKEKRKKKVETLVKIERFKI